MQAPCVPGLVSIILPVYNQAGLLSGSIESVLNQTYPSIELIVVNDGSSDGVEEVLARYAGRPMVRVLTQSNQKLPKALSNGFEFARGEFWTWTSADNLMHPDQLARQVAFLRARPEAEMVYADYLAIDDRGRPLCDPSFRPQNRRHPTSPEVHLPEDPHDINLVEDNFIGPCFLYRSIVGRLIGEYDPNLGVEDYDYWMRVNHAFSIMHLGTDETLYSYRVHDNSLSSRAAELRLVERLGKLMHYERDRRDYYQRPWTFVFDSAMKTRLSRSFPPSYSWVDLPPAFEQGLSRRLEAEKVLFAIESSRLPTLVESGLPASTLVAAWFDSTDEVYDRRVEATRFRMIGFTDRVEVAERMELLGMSAVVVGSPGLMVRLAVQYANNRAYYEQTRPVELRCRNLPKPFRAPGRKHILIQMDDFDQGGLENVVLGLAQGLRSRGMDISLLVLRKLGPAADQARKAGFSVLTLPVEDRERAYRELLREQKIELVNAHYSPFGARIATEQGIPFVQVVHNSYVWLEDDVIALYREADRFTTGYLCVSSETARYCDANLGLSVSKMVVVPNGIDGDRLDAARISPPALLRHELGLSPTDFVFLNVASIHATKGQKVLIKALAEVIKTHPHIRLVMVGSASDPNYEADLQRMIRQLNVQPHVILAGQRQDVGRFYWMCDAFVLPSFWEGWSLALTEAVYTGLPVVATEVGGARELLAGGEGLLVKPPFSSIGELNAYTIAGYVHREDPAFVANLAEAMRQIASSRCRIVVPDSKKRVLDQEHMVELHETILEWFLQGGQAKAARSWTRPVMQSDPVVAPSASQSSCAA